MAAGCEDWGTDVCAQPRTLSMRAIGKTQIFLRIFTFRPLKSGKVTTSHGKGGVGLVKSRGGPGVRLKSAILQSLFNCISAAVFAQLFAVQLSIADARDPKSR